MYLNSGLYSAACSDCEEEYVRKTVRIFDGYKTGDIHINVTLKRVRVTIIVVEKL
jgi:hypothetical protein